MYVDFCLSSSSFFLKNRVKFNYLIDQFMLFELELINKRVVLELLTNILSRVEPESSSSLSI